MMAVFTQHSDREKTNAAPRLGYHGGRDVAARVEYSPSSSLPAEDPVVARADLEELSVGKASLSQEGFHLLRRQAFL